MLRARWSGGFEIFFCSSIKQDPTMRPIFIMYYFLVVLFIW
ncbi:hypothetical protein LEP1GSC081_2197 [Leptospira kirschneri str. H1]|uniref:Uncharacterized protein n=1 Tax=Leptospira kirschneri str. H1 TaxID=1049966 RepID=A0A0E2AWW9_9LEPT|nr:hypothetical protein LEP1GSC081_2197 [Leptospira kirschneri str. H1]